MIETGQFKLRDAVSVCLRRLSAFVLPGLFSACGAGEEQETLENLPLSVDGRQSVIVKTVHIEYPFNRYVSLRDMASALAQTARRFQIEIVSGKTIVRQGAEYLPQGGENLPFSKSAETGSPDGFIRPILEYNPLEIDGRKLRYRTVLKEDSETGADLFIRLADLAMQLDLCVKLDKGRMEIDSRRPFRVTEALLRNPALYYEIHSALVGDADTGEIFLSHEARHAVPIASTSKLMTYLVLSDAIREGKITASDPVRITKESARLSKGEDAVIPMEEGMMVPMEDLLKGMLIPSSNECSLALAIHAAGSEAAFVKKMNQKAGEIGLSKQAVFFNCHGLPAYTDDFPASKIQNRMSAMDMFRLVRHMLSACPQVTEITSLKTAELKGLGYTAENTNPLLYNVSGVIGLKTGTTDMAGYCLAAVREVPDRSGKIHRIAAIEFGGEDETVRTTFTEELIRYGTQRLLEKDSQCDS